MAPSSFIKLAALSLLVPLVMGNPFASSALGKRQCTTMGLTISSCTSCTGDGTGPPVCQTSPYNHFGAENECSCSDEEVPFNSDYCTTDGTIPTPYGDGNWEEASGCSAGNAVGTAGGTIVPADGSTSWSCSCVNGMGSCADDCGLEYSCTEVWNCACSQC